MRTVPLVVLLCLAVLLIGPAVGIAEAGRAAAPRHQLKEYPIRVKVAQVSEGRQESVVYVVIGWGSCRNPKEVELNQFMKQNVPEALRRCGRLPDPARVATGVKEGVVDLSEKLGKDVTVVDQGRLPVWLAVEATRKPSGALSPDGHERFSGDVSDTWSVRSCFVTRFCARAPITKFHEEQDYTYTKIIRAAGSRAVFRWVDP